LFVEMIKFLFNQGMSLKVIDQNQRKVPVFGKSTSELKTNLQTKR
jgi:hypothetical protein